MDQAERKRRNRSSVVVAVAARLAELKVVPERVHELVVALLPVYSSVDRGEAAGGGLAERLRRVVLAVAAAAVVAAPRGAGGVRGAAAAAAAHPLYDLRLCSQLSLDVIELRFRGGVVLSLGGGRFDSSSRFGWGPELRARLAGANRLLLNPSLDLTAPLCPCFLHLDAAAELLQDKFPRVMVNDEHTILLIRPFVSFKYCHRRRRAWNVR